MTSPFPDLASLLWLSLAATAAGALQGALLGRRREAGVDIFGMLALATCLGFGGGIIRDVLVGNLPPMALRSPWYVVIVLACTAVVFALGRQLERYAVVLIVLDAATLGLFAAVGSQAAIQAQLPDVAAVLVGTLAAVGGGVAASLLMQERPMVLQPGPPYALAALAGATVYVILDGYSTGLASCACVAVVFIIRVWTWRAGVTTKPIVLPGENRPR